ncbi:MAG: hypothetical protein ACUVSB_11870 [Anaerolineae bacterium]
MHGATIANRLDHPGVAAVGQHASAHHAAEIDLIRARGTAAFLAEVVLHTLCVHQVDGEVGALAQPIRDARHVVVAVGVGRDHRRVHRDSVEQRRAATGTEEEQQAAQRERCHKMDNPNHVSPAGTSDLSLR